MKRIFLLLFLIVAAGVPVPAQPAAAAPAARPPSGWVKANVVNGGCNSQGQCSSYVTPGSPALFEYKPDRQPVGRNFDLGSNYAQHGGYPTYESREICHNGDVNAYWASGIWHHGGYWTMTIDSTGHESWSGPSRQHWAFEHTDSCPVLPPPPPTSTPLPTPPPPPPGAPTYTPLPPTPVPTDLPTPTPDPLCLSVGDNWDQRANVQITVPGAETQEYAWDDPVPPSYAPISDVYGDPSQSGRVPPYTLGLIGGVQPDVPLTFAYDFSNMATGPNDSLSYTGGHSGQADVQFGLRDLTSGQDLIVVDHVDQQQMKDDDGNVVIWGNTLRAARALIDPSVTFLDSSTQTWDKWDRQHSSHAWYEKTAQPYVSKFMHRLGVSYVQFTPQNGHAYLAWAWNGHGPCKVEAPRWTVVQFVAGNGPVYQPTSTPIFAVPPTLTPTNTATPAPPPPPVPDAAFKISIHSTLDPRSDDSDPRNAVYKSTGNTIAWPAGEVLDFTPRVQIVLNPAAPSYSGYRFQAHVQDWSFVSSLGQRAATARDGMGRAGCRGGGRQTSGGSGAACTYSYIGGGSLTDSTEPTEAQMANQAHVYWAPNPPQSMRPDVYVYTLGQLTQVDLKVEVRIVVEVVNVETGQVVGSRTDTTTGTFAVNLVVPRSAK
jgi:hypothetical protein